MCVKKWKKMEVALNAAALPFNCLQDEKKKSVLLLTGAGTRYIF